MTDVLGEKEMGGHGCEPPASSNFICFVFRVSFFKAVSPA